MGAMFAFIFAIITCFVAFSLFTLACLLRKKVKVAAIITYIISGICFLPILLFVFIIAFHIVEEIKAKNDYAKENGRIFAELVYGNPSSVYKQLLKAEEINIFDKYGESPLYIVATRDKNYIEVMEKMFEHGANPNIVNKNNGKSPLHVAVSTSLANIEMVNCLIKNGADINMQDKDGYTPLMLCCENCKYLETESLRIVDILIENSCDTKIKNNKNEDAKNILLRLMNEKKEEMKEYPTLDYKENNQYKLYEKLLEKII